MSQIIPTSGPISGHTDVIVQGMGFLKSENELEQPRCRFGSPSNYVSVDAEILSYTRMVCKTPSPGLQILSPSQWPVDMPFGIALA